MSARAMSEGAETERAMSERGLTKLGWLLAFVAASGLGMGALVGIGCALGANSCPFTEQQPVTTTDGRELWFQAACASCHGRDGTGGRGPSLVSGEAAQRSHAELVAKIERGSPGLMPRFKGKLTRAQIESVARYVMALREAA